VRPHDLTLSVGEEVGFDLHIERAIAQGPVIQIEAMTTDHRKIDGAFARQEVASLTAGSTIRVTARKAHLFDPVG
jgi:ABC-type sulfate/molybdate transport systems ATPase subunit